MESHPRRSDSFPCIKNNVLQRLSMSQGHKNDTNVGPSMEFLAPNKFRNTGVGFFTGDVLENNTRQDGRFSLKCEGGILDGLTICGDRLGNFTRFVYTNASNLAVNLQCRLTKSNGSLIPVLVTITTIQAGDVLVLSGGIPEKIFWGSTDTMKKLETLFESAIHAIQPHSLNCTCRCPNEGDCRYLTRRVDRIGYTIANAPSKSILIIGGAGISQKVFSKVIYHHTHYNNKIVDIPCRNFNFCRKYCK